MSEKETSTQSAEELELAAAQERLRQASANVAKLRQAHLDKAAADLAAHRAEEENRLAAMRAEQEAIQQKHRERKAKEAADRLAEAMARKAEEDRLAAEVSKREEEQRVFTEAAAKVKAIQDAAHALELEQQQLESALQQSLAVREEPVPITLNSPSHPLSAIFGTNAAPVVQNEGLDSHQQALLQAQADKAAVQSKAWHPKKSSGSRYVDSSSSFTTEQAIFKATTIRANTQTLDRLSSVFEAEDLLRAFTEVALPAHQQRPCSHDSLLGMMEAALESNCA